MKNKILKALLSDDYNNETINKKLKIYYDNLTDKDKKTIDDFLLILVGYRFTTLENMNENDFKIL